MEDREISLNVFMGLFGSGKSYAISQFQSQGSLVLAFERGNVETKDTLYLLPADWKEKRQESIQHFVQEFEKRQAHSLIIEWNGLLPFGDLLILTEELERQGLPLKWEKIFYVIDPPVFRQMSTQTPIPLEQATEADVFLVLKDELTREDARLIRSIQTFPNILTNQDLRTEMLTLEENRTDGTRLSIVLLGFINILLVSYLLKVFFQIPVGGILSVFAGIVLQAIPFLILGVMISALIQVYLSDRIIAKLFPEKGIRSFFFAILAGLFLPVCDCASVPVFRALLRKKVPLASAVLFLLVAPIVNPVVILSTLYAFNGDWTMVGLRMGLGILVGTITALSFLHFPKEDLYRRQYKLLSLRKSGLEEKRFRRFLDVSYRDFTDVFLYLMLGAGIAAISTYLLKGTGGSFQAATGGMYFVDVFLMMVFTVLISLCSSSDAIVARTFQNLLPRGAMLAFLVYGPMMDLKNLWMLRESFSKKFILRLVAVSFVTTFLVFAFGYFFGLDQVMGGRI